MFKNPFGITGRISRTEYALSYALYFVVYLLYLKLLNLYAFLPTCVAVWFFICQSAKRCHDIGNSGWWQLIPFYNWWLLFRRGDNESNEYGEVPLK